MNNPNDVPMALVDAIKRVQDKVILKDVSSGDSFMDECTKGFLAGRKEGQVLAYKELSLMLQLKSAKLRNGAKKPACSKIYKELIDEAESYDWVISEVEGRLKELGKMSDLKEFLENNSLRTEEQFDGGSLEIVNDRLSSPEMAFKRYEQSGNTKFISIMELGAFYWGRGGKQFANYLIKKYREPYNEELSWISDKALALTPNERADFAEEARDFLDCLDCLGEDKVKELIKELK
jgi:hypothetical protein